MENFLKIIFNIILYNNVIKYPATHLVQKQFIFQLLMLFWLLSLFLV